MHYNEIEAIAAELGGSPSGQKTTYTVHCPCHHDTKPSLSLSQSEDGKILVHCHAGCEQDRVVSELKRRGLWNTIKTRKVSIRPKIVAEYHYVDPETLKLKFQVVRYEPKGFRQRRPTPNGGWDWSVPRSERILFNLPAVTQSKGIVFVVEGEKDVLNLARIGLVATCNPSGAGKWEPSYSVFLSNRDVCILPDNDTAGRQHAELVANHLAGVARSVRVVELPGLPPKGDVSAWIDAGGTANQLMNLLHTAALWTASLPKQAEAKAEVDTGSLQHGSDVEIAHRVRDLLASRYGPVVFSEGQLWRFLGTHWAPVEEYELRRIVHEFDGATYASSDRGESTVRLNKARVSSIIHECQAICHEPDFFKDAAQGINCASGFIKFDEHGTPTLELHEREQRCRHVLSGAWHGEQTTDLPDGSLLGMLLSGSFKGDPDAEEKCALLAEIAGVAALGYATKLRQPRAVVLYGQTAENGKSQILDLIRGLLPPSAVCSISVAKMSDEKRIVGLVGKLLNASDELSNDAVSSDMFKALVTGEPVDGRDVYKSRVEFRSVAQHIFATNTLPPFKGGIDRGVQRRLLVIPFSRTVPMAERVERIGQRVAKEEANLLLAWTVTGASRVIRQKNFSIPKTSEKTIMDWVYAGDPVQAWVDHAVTIVDQSECEPIQTSEVYFEFKEWAKIEGYQQHEMPPINTFSQRLSALIPIKLGRASGGKRIIRGIKISNSGDPNTLF